MKNMLNLDVDHDFFSGKRSGEVVILSFKERPFLRLPDLDAKEVLFGYLGRVSSHHDVKVARVYAEKPATYLSGIKRLLNYDIKTLEGCLECENELLRRAIRSLAFKKMEFFHGTARYTGTSQVYLYNRIKDLKLSF